MTVFAAVYNRQRQDDRCTDIAIIILWLISPSRKRLLRSIVVLLIRFVYIRKPIQVIFLLVSLRAGCRDSQLTLTG